MKKLILICTLGLIIISCGNNKEKYLPYYELIGKPINEVSKIEKRTIKEEIERHKRYYINTGTNYISYDAEGINLDDTITSCYISLNKKTDEYADIIKSINKEFKKKYKHKSYSDICNIYTTSNYKYLGIYLKYIPDKPNIESFDIYKIDDKKRKSFKEHLESSTDYNLAEFVEEKASFILSLNEFAISISSLKHKGLSDKEIEYIMLNDY